MTDRTIVDRITELELDLIETRRENSRLKKEKERLEKRCARYHALQNEVSRRNLKKAVITKHMEKLIDEMAQA